MKRFLLRAAWNSACASTRRACSPAQPGVLVLANCSVFQRRYAGTKNTSLPDKVDVVIVGGGVVGCSSAYHISDLLPGRSVLLLEQGSLGCGTTWHAAGLVGQVRASKSETLISGVYGTQVYSKLEELTGLSAGFSQCGSISLARTPERMEQLLRNASRARSYGLEGKQISLEEVNEMCGGVFETKRYFGAIHLPGDGAIDASNVCALFAAAARLKQATIVERAQVLAVEPQDHGKKGFRICTEHGDISAKVVVNSAGQWARQFGRLCGVNVPLHSCEHFYLYTRPGSFSVPSKFPVVRDPDGYLYARYWSGGLLVGSFEPNAKPCFDHGSVPDKFEFSLLDNDWDHFMPYFEDAARSIPALEDAQVDLLNGPESFTTDNSYLLGEVPGLRNYFVAAGMNSSGIASAAGVGHHLAQWIAEGIPAKHIWSVDVRRVQHFQANQRYLKERATESLNHHYKLLFPKHEAMTARGVRRSPLFDLLHAEGARFGQKAGWERPNYFCPGEVATDPFRGDGLQPTTWGEAPWMKHAFNEHRACRTSAALFDTSSFAKLLVVGDDAEECLSWLCANEVRNRKNFSTYTQMCNSSGGVEADITVREISSWEWLILTGTDKGPRDKAWIEMQCEGKKVRVIDVTSMYSVLSLMGPESPRILALAAGFNEDEAQSLFDSWKPHQARKLDVGHAVTTAVRTSYVGEQNGWELHMESDMVQHVYLTLQEMASIQSVALWNAGYLAQDSLRIQAGRVAWGAELSAEETPLDAGLGFAVKLEKPGGFLGQTALVSQKALPRTLRCCQFEVSHGEAYIWGGEPILVNGEYSGQNVTSGARVPILSGSESGGCQSVALGYATSKNQEGIDRAWLDRQSFEIEVGNNRFAAKPRLFPLRR